MKDPDALRNALSSKSMWLVGFAVAVAVLYGVMVWMQKRAATRASARAREVPEVGVVGDEGDVVVDADLCDQSVRELCFVTGFENAPPELTSMLPVVVVEMEEVARLNTNATNSSSTAGLLRASERTIGGSAA